MTTIVDKTGRVVARVNGDDDAVQLNTPRGCIAVDDPPNEDMYYTETGWVRIPPSPGGGFIFDYSSKSWVDARNVPDVRSAHWSRIKSERDQLEFGGFEYKGNVYDSDQVSQGRIMGAAAAGIDQVWTLANNTTVNLTGDELKELYATLQRHIASLHERGRIARFNIDVAMTPQEIEAVTL